MTNTGRFTAPDPARDLRGDGDVYDYCADDPVSRIDPTGLAWVPPDEEEEDAETLPRLRLSDLIIGGKVQKQIKMPEPFIQ